MKAPKNVANHNLKGHKHVTIVITVWNIISGSSLFYVLSIHQIINQKYFFSLGLLMNYRKKVYLWEKPWT